MSRTTVPLNIPAGVVKSAGKLEARSRYIDADKMRFRDGQAEKIGGWAKLTTTALTGIARAAKVWNNGTGTAITAIGTNSRLYTLDTANALVDITPHEKVWRLNPTFTTTNGSPTVTVAHPGHGLLVGQVVIFSKTSATVGGLTMDGARTIVAVVDADSYTFTHGSNATSTVSSPEAETTATAKTALTNTFTTANGTPTVTVAHTAHGKVVGQRVTFSDSSGAVGGLAMDGTWTIATVVNANSYTFTHTSNATSTAGPSATTNALYEIAAGEVDPTGGFGFGIGDYGEEDYGTPRSATSLVFQPHYWTLTNFGRFLMAVPYGGKLYLWDPIESPVVRAQAVGGAPGQNRGLFVTPERFIVSWGASETVTGTLDPMVVRWCSQADYTDWEPTEFNTANSRKLTEGKQIMAGGPIGEGQAMLWTDTAAYTMRYTGSQYVFETRLASTVAGCAGPTAWCEAHGRAFWYGSGRFYSYGSGIDMIAGQEAVLPWLQGIVRDTYLTKTVCFFNQAHNEIWWLFVTDDDTEPGVYVAHNLTDSSWVSGTLERTAAYTTATGGNVQPHLIGADGYIYTHEHGVDADGIAMACHIETGPFQLEEGEGLVSIQGYIPDFSTRTGAVTITLKARDRAAGDVIDTDILTIDDDEDDTVLDARIRGRVMSFRVEQSVLNGTFGIGAPAAQIATGGRKR
jgi:hypothetical protein